MTEQKWLTSTSPRELVAWLCQAQNLARTRAGRRKLRLYACACVRRVWERVTDAHARKIVEVSEGFADGVMSADELAAARNSVEIEQGWGPPAIRAAVHTAEAQPRMAAEQVGWEVCSAVASHGAGYSERWEAEAAAQAAVLREVVGNPLRPIGTGPWLTSAVKALAQGIYHEQSLGDLPILADALAEAGCEEAELVAHCRGSEPHHRGCWVLDLLRGQG